MQDCLDEEDFISKIKNKYKPNKQQETDLRICYKNAKAMENIDLPFGD
jgi:thiamine pyrophosphokinase